MKSKSLMIALGAVALLAGGQANAAEKWEGLLAKIYADAKKDGEVIVNSERVEEVGGKEGVAAFEKRFPGIKVTFNGMAGSKLSSVVIAEAQAGKVSIDIFRSDPDRAEPLAKRNLLLDLKADEISDQPIKTYFEGHFVKMSDHLSNFAVNTDLVKKADWPKKYEDLLDPKWNRKLALDARGGQIAHLLSNHIWDETRFWNLVDGLKKNNPIWTTRNTEAMGKIAAGEGAIGTGSYAAVGELQEQGAPVDFLFLSPALSQVRGMAIVKNGAHPTAAKLFLAWMLSPEGLQARDKHDVGVIAPGTRLYDKIKAQGAEITIEDDINQIMARDKVGEEITKRWGALK
jgi:iron(III) transport system substrate-binding protein